MMDSTLGEMLVALVFIAAAAAAGIYWRVRKQRQADQQEQHDSMMRSINEEQGMEPIANSAGDGDEKATDSGSADSTSSQEDNETSADSGASQTPDQAFGFPDDTDDRRTETSGEAAQTASKQSSGARKGKGKGKGKGGGKKNA